VGGRCKTKEAGVEAAALFRSVLDAAASTHPKEE
jgi:hypothetical protein